MGIVCYYQGNFSEALKHFEKSLENNEKAKDCLETAKFFQREFNKLKESRN